ncbi:hypothetical protein MXL26_00535 [Acinetobacter towneri]|nr:hypothetical protein [Acinetobacter towneri]MEB6563881.1 hypothetical protein [Acinetobacter towneri]
MQEDDAFTDAFVYVMYFTQIKIEIASKVQDKKDQPEMKLLKLQPF